MNKKTFILMSLVMFIIVLSGCHMVRKKEDITSGEMTKQKEFKEIEIDENIFGNCSGSQASMMMDGQVTLYGGYYIFTDYSHGFARTYMLDGDGNAHLFCLDDSCNHTGHCSSKLFSMWPMQYYKGDIYFHEHTAVYMMDGNLRKLVYNNINYIDNFSIKDDKMYISDEKGICYVDLNTKEKTYLTELMSAPFSLNVYNDKIYFASADFQLYSMNFDGSELTLLSDDFGFIPQYHNGKLYYRMLSGKKINNDTLVELDLATGNKRTLATNVYHIRVCNDAIYYCESQDEDGYFSYKKYLYDTEEIKDLGKTYFANFMVFDEYDYIVAYDYSTYEDEHGNEEYIYYPYIMDKNGQNKRYIELPEIIK